MSSHAVSLLLLGAAGLLLPGAGEAQSLVVEAEVVRTASEAGTLGPAVILIEEGRIASIREGRADEFEDLPSDVPLLRAAAVLPGLVDARSTVGLAGLHPADDETEEVGRPVRAELRAVDSWDPSEPLVRQALRTGVTTAQVTPGNANSVGGQAAVVRMSAEGVGEAVIRAPSAMVISFTEAVKEAYGEEGQLPTTRMGNVALIRQAFLDAAHHAEEGSDAPAPGHEAMGRVLTGELPALLAADHRHEIAAALRVAREFDLRARVVGGSEASAMTNALAEAGVPVLLVHPREQLAGVDRPDEVLGAARELTRRGVPVALVSGIDGAPPTLLEWAVEASGHGLSADEALAAVTRTPARLLGVDAQVGSLEPGKVADLVLLDGDPFARPSGIEAVVAGGEALYRK